MFCILFHELRKSGGKKIIRRLYDVVYPIKVYETTFYLDKYQRKFVLVQLRFIEHKT